MTKQVEVLVTKLRSENPQRFAELLHSLGHALTPDEAESIHQHSHEVHDASEIDEVVRLDNIAKELESLAGQVRAGILAVPNGEVTASIYFEQTKPAGIVN